jgi:hypothetical protein
MAEEHELPDRPADALLAVKVPRRIVEERDVARSEFEIRGQRDPSVVGVGAIVEPLPSQVSIASCDDAHDPPGVVVVDWRRRVGGKAGEHEHRPIARAGEDRGDGARTVEILDAAYRSARSGKLEATAR